MSYPACQLGPQVYPIGASYGLACGLGMMTYSGYMWQVTKRPVLHAKYDQVYPIGASYALHVAGDRVCRQVQWLRRWLCCRHGRHHLPQLEPGRAEHLRRQHLPGGVTDRRLCACGTGRRSHMRTIIGTSLNSRCMDPAAVVIHSFQQKGVYLSRVGAIRLG
jgi:hypothetical protein